MYFNSLSYFIFLPAVFFLFNFTNERLRWMVLLVASYGFYASFKAPQLLLVLVVVTAASYFCGVYLGRERDEKRRKWIYWSGVACCILILSIMKYLPPLFKTSTESLPYPNLLLSIGVSYFVLQAISYLTDIYLGLVEPEYHLGYQALYLAFFPKLLQGPIERANDLIPQIRQPYRFNYNSVRAGMVLFAWGLFQKVVIADRLAFFADRVYNDVNSYAGFQLLFATYIYALQIFFDFSGYTDMARGTGRIFGITLTQNFNNPYFASSIADFWRRWHISFSRWILDYIFKPLQMAWRGKGQAGTALALLVTFLASGLWHGATAGFIVWGLLHGLYLATSTFYRAYQKKFHKWSGVEKYGWYRIWQAFATFHLVCFTWIFFRANSIDDAMNVVTKMFHYRATSNGWQVLFINGKLEFIIPLAGITLYLLANKFVTPEEPLLFRLPTSVRWAMYTGLVMILMLFNSNSNLTFIYNSF